MAFLNARLLPARSNSSLALSVQASEQVVDLGKCPDMGTCKSLRRDGKRCTMIVNVRECQYCEYHVNAQYKKVAAGRMDLAGARSGGRKSQVASKASGNNKRGRNNAWNSLRKSWDVGRRAGGRSANINIATPHGLVGVPHHVSAGTYEVPGLGSTTISGRGSVVANRDKKAGTLGSSSHHSSCRATKKSRYGALRGRAIV